MPELPDITIYISALQARIRGRILEKIRIVSPFLLRTVAPPVNAAHGLRVKELRRLGKRIVLEMEGELFLVLHLMIAGRLRWDKPGGKYTLATFAFDNGTLTLTEAGSKKRASLHVTKSLDEHTRGGLEVMTSDIDSFRTALRMERHTLKRSLTDPRIFSGIGNAYSDEILHAARLSPLKHSDRLSDDEIARLHRAVISTLQFWIDRIREEAGDGFPEKVTAFRKGMAVHGRFKEPCPDCGSPVQRIRYASNETNYCARCQTDGKVLKDRSLSRLLKDDWPRNIEELE